MDFEYSYKFTENAENDLDEIIRYIREKLFNPSAAVSFFKRVFESIDNLRKFPLSGMLVENEFLPNKDIRKVVIDNYIMYYLAGEAKREIIIVRIIYGKRNLEKIRLEITD